MITAGHVFGGLGACVICFLVFTIYHGYLYSAFFDGMKHKKEYREVWSKVKWVIENCKVESYTETFGHTSYYMKNDVGIYLDRMKHKLIIKDVGFFDKPKDLYVELPWQYMVRARWAFFKQDIRESREISRKKKASILQKQKEDHDANIKYLEKSIQKIKGGKK